MLIKIIKDKYKRIIKVYEGSIYQVTKNNNNFLTSGNYMNKTEVVEKIYFKRPFFTDLYVKEISSGKRIPTFVLHKFLRLPVHTFVLLNRKGVKFQEKYAENVKDYKKSNKKDRIKEIFNIGRERRSKSKLSIWHYAKKENINKVSDNLSNLKTIFLNKLNEFKMKNKTKNIIKRNDEKVEKVTIQEENIIKPKNDEKKYKDEVSIQEIIECHRNKKLNLSEISTKNLIKIKEELMKMNTNKILNEKEEVKSYEGKNLNKIADEILALKEAKKMLQIKIDGIDINLEKINSKEDLLSYYMYKNYGQKDFATENIRNIINDEESKIKELKK